MGIVLNRLRGHALIEPEFDAGLEEERAADVGARRKHHHPAHLRRRVNGFLDGPSVERLPVTFRAVVGHVEDRALAL